MQLTNPSLESQRNKTIGKWLLPFSLILFCLQFVLLAKGTVLPVGNTIVSYAVNLGPIVLILISLHLLFGKTKIPKKPALVRILVVLMASYSAGGAVLLMITTLGLGIVGSSAGNWLFDHFGLLILLLTLIAFPIVNKYLQ